MTAPGGAGDVGLHRRHDVRQIAQVGAAGAMLGTVLELARAEHLAHVLAPKTDHGLVVGLGQITRNGGDLHRRAHRHGRAPEGVVHLAVGIEDTLQGLAANERLDGDLRRHHAHRVAAPGDDRVDADGVLVVEGLPLIGDGGHGQGGRVEGVDALLGASARMGGLADEADLLDDGAVGRPGHVGGKRVGLGVEHHRQVHVVEMAEPNELRLAGEELDLVARLALHALVDVDHLFGRNREEHQRTAELRQHHGGQEPHGGAHHPGHLRVVAAGVGRAGAGIGMGVVRHPERVQLAQNGQGGAGTAAVLTALDAGDGQTLLRIEPELPEPRGHELRGPDLVEPRLRVPENRFAEIDDFPSAGIDDPAGFGLEFLPGGHGLPLIADSSSRGAVRAIGV